MDVAVFVLTADPPVSASERELISQVARLSVTMFVVLNKADHLSAAELAEVAEFTSEVAARAAGRPVPVYHGRCRAGYCRCRRRKTCARRASSHSGSA